MSKNEHSADTIFTQQLKWTLKTLPNTGQLYPLAFFSQAIWHSRSCDLRRIMSAQLNKTLITPHHALFTWANVTRPHARHLPWWVCWPECRIHGRLPGPLRIHPDLAPLISPTVMIGKTEPGCCLWAGLLWDKPDWALHHFFPLQSLSVIPWPFIVKGLLESFVSLPGSCYLHSSASLSLHSEALVKWEKTLMLTYHT